MDLTKKEQLVIKLLSEWKIATKKSICQKLNLSHMTVVRALEKYGYYSSFNKNSSFYTLGDIPKFDSHGLWYYKGAGFSKYRTINKTIVALIEESPRGYTEKAMSSLLQTKVANILSRLLREKRLDKIHCARRSIYLSVKEQQKSKQITKLKEEIKKRELQKQRYNFTKGILPEGIELKTVILTLIRMIEQPESTVASLSKNLQSKQIKVTSKEIREIISFYGLEKKTAQ